MVILYQVLIGLVAEITTGFNLGILVDICTAIPLGILIFGYSLKLLTNM